MITAFLVALIYIGILCIVVGVVLAIVGKFAPIPAPVGQIIWAIAGIFCLLLLLAAVTGGLPPFPLK